MLHSEDMQTLHLLSRFMHFSSAPTKPTQPIGTLTSSTLLKAGQNYSSYIFPSLNFMFVASWACIQ